MIHARESVRTFESAERESAVPRRNVFRALAVGLVLSIVALFGLSSPASAVPATKSVSTPSVVTAAAVTGNPPTQDCVTMASLVLGGLAIRAGAEAWAVGQGAIAQNAREAVGYIFDVASSYKCLNYLVPAYINSICQQSHGALFNYHTLEARTLVLIATRGHKTLC